MQFSRPFLCSLCLGLLARLSGYLIMDGLVNHITSLAPLITNKRHSITWYTFRTKVFLHFGVRTEMQVHYRIVNFMDYSHTVKHRTSFSTWNQNKQISVIWPHPHPPLRLSVTSRLLVTEKKNHILTFEFLVSPNSHILLISSIAIKLSCTLEK